MSVIVQIDYTNHRDERATRNIFPVSLWFGKKEPYYPTERWLLDAYDIEKGVLRTFDPQKIHSWATQGPQ